VEITHQTPSED
jgi:hypothetical protein